MTQHRVISRRWFVGLDVERRTAKLPRIKGVKEIIEANEAPTGRVDEVAVRAQQAKPTTVDTPKCLTRQWCVQRNDIGTAEEFVNVHHLDRVTVSHVRVVSDDLSEPDASALDDGPTDPAEPEHAEYQAVSRVDRPRGTVIPSS